MSKRADTAAGKAANDSAGSSKSGKAAKPGKPDKMGRGEYLERLAVMQLELNNVARWLQSTGKRLAVIVEGRDTAGKGGVISAISSTLNPRQCHVVALGKPSDQETTQWYFQRYIPHLPAAGELVLFDRSWYNRAGVEKVMGWATEAQVKAFLTQAPVFEKLLVDDGLLLFKYWLTVDQAQQEERFAERLTDPLKRWKLSPTDLESRTRYSDYTLARQAMLDKTHTRSAPWTLVNFNDQRRGRLNMIRHLLDHVPEHKVQDAPLVFPALAHKPSTERFKGPFKPI